MVQCKSNTTKVRSMFTWLEELVTRKDHVQTKADCSQFGTPDVSLAAMGKASSRICRLEINTISCKEKDLAQKVSNVKGILAGFDRLNIPPTL